MIARALTYAGAAALLAAAWTLLEWAFGFHGERAQIGAVSGFVGLLFPLVLLPLGVRAEKRAAPEAFGWKRGMTFTAVAAAIFAILGAAFFYAYHAWLNPSFGQLMAEHAPAAQAEAVRAAYAPATQALTVGVSGLIVALLIGLIATAVYARRSRVSVAPGS